MKNNIDFVILWVDGNDQNWLSEKFNYLSESDKLNNNDSRFRDWELLRYWFRAIEENAPWFNNIYFITYGHVPIWLNLENKKLKVISHKDFIPEKYLPTFNSNVIELNLHRINTLNEQFVLFNDDFFLNKKVSPNFFFKNNLPCDVYSEDIIMANDNYICSVLFNNAQILNKHFNKKIQMKANYSKIFNPKYGKYLIRNLLLSPWSRYSTFKSLHLPQSFLKSSFEQIWQLETSSLDNMCRNKFRKNNDISQYLIRDWQLVSGQFTPASAKRGIYFDISNDSKRIEDVILNSKSEMICLNDTNEVDFELAKKEIKKIFQLRYPKKSSFER